jgi:hypothetical protein
MELKNNKKHLIPFNGTEEQQHKILYHSMEMKNNKKIIQFNGTEEQTLKYLILFNGTEEKQKTPFTIQWN